MKNGYKYIAFLSIILFQFHTKTAAQNIATSVMNVTVEVVSGSTVEMDRPDWITFNQEATTSQYAIITLRNQEKSAILISSSNFVTLANGADQFEMNSLMSEFKNESGDLELHFTAHLSENGKQGVYSGKQTAEIIYL